MPETGVLVPKERWAEERKAIPQRLRRYYNNFHEAARHPSLEPFIRPVIAALVRAIYRPRVTGLENIPATGPAVIIANHVSYLDGLLISAICPRPVRYVIDRDIYRTPGVHYFMRINRAIPIFPKKEEVQAALDTISEGLKQGDLICIFPEGQLTYTGHLGRFKPGIEFMIQRDSVPVIPMGLEGLWGSIFSRKYRKAPFRWFPRHLRTRISIAIGHPVMPEKVKVDHLQRVVLKLMGRAIKTQNRP